MKIVYSYIVAADQNSAIKPACHVTSCGVCMIYPI